jgi:hypothetical protein
MSVALHHVVPDGYAVHGHAIVSADDFIAGPDGLTPPELRNEADWERFQAALDAAVVTVLGRIGHEANPNQRRRRRLVLTSRVAALEPGEHCHFWNPAGLPLAAALAAVAPGGGIIAVPGGQPVFDLFLAIGYDAFHLARAETVRLGAGTRLFSGLGPGLTAVDRLAGAGLSVAATQTLDSASGVTLTVWRRPPGITAPGRDRVQAAGRR